MVLAAPGAEGAGQGSGRPLTERSGDVERAIALIGAMGSPLEEVAAALGNFRNGAEQLEVEPGKMARPVRQLGGLVGALGNLLRRSPALAKASGVAEAFRASVDRSILARPPDDSTPDLGPLREPLVPALQFFCPGFYAVSGLVLGSLPPVPAADGAGDAVGLLCDDLPLPGGGPPMDPPAGDLSYFDVRTVGELLRFGAQSAFLPGTPLVDQGVALSSAAVDSNGSSAFSANLYPGSLVEAVPGVVALLGFPLTLPPLYPYIARASNPGPATSDSSIFPSQAAAGYQFDGLSSRADAPSLDAARAETAAVKLAQPGLIEVAAVHGTSTVERTGALVRSTSQTRLQGIDIAGGFISIGEFVSSLSIANTGAASQARIDHKVSLGGVRVLGIPVELTDKGLVVSSAEADPGTADPRHQLAETVKAFDLQIEVMSPVVSETVEGGARVVEVISPGLRITYRLPKDLASLPVPVLPALLNNARAEFKLGYTAAFSNVTAADSSSALTDLGGGQASGRDGDGGATAATGVTPAQSEFVAASPSVGDDGQSTEGPATGGDWFPGFGVSGGAEPASGVTAAGAFEAASPILELRQSPAAASLAIAMSEPARRNAYVFSLVLITLGLAVVGWRTVLYNPGPPRHPAGGAGKNGQPDTTPTD
jgi:hypothetical protein